MFPQKPILREAVAGVVCEGVHRPLLHLVFDGLVEEEDGRACFVLERRKEGEDKEKKKPSPLGVWRPCRGGRWQGLLRPEGKKRKNFEKRPEKKKWKFFFWKNFEKWFVEQEDGRPCFVLGKRKTFEKRPEKKSEHFFFWKKNIRLWKMVCRAGRWPDLLRPGEKKNLWKNGKYVVFFYSKR